VVFERKREDVEGVEGVEGVEKEGLKFYIQQERPSFTTFPNTVNRVQKTTRSGVFLTNFELFVNVVKHCLEGLIYLLNRK